MMTTVGVDKEEMMNAIAGGEAWTVEPVPSKASSTNENDHVLTKPLGEIGQQIRQMRQTVQMICQADDGAPSSSGHGTRNPTITETNNDQRLWELESICNELNEELQELRQMRHDLRSPITSTTISAPPTTSTTMVLTPIKPSISDSIPHILTPIPQREWNEPEPIEYGELRGEHTQLAAQITTVMKEITALRIQQAAEKERQRQTFGCFYDDVSMQWTPMHAFVLGNDTNPTTTSVPAAPESEPDYSIPGSTAAHRSHITPATHRTSYTTPYTAPYSAPIDAPSSTTAGSTSSVRMSQAGMSSSWSKNLGQDIGIGPYPTPRPGNVSGTHSEGGTHSGSSHDHQARPIISHTSSSSNTTGGRSKTESALAIHEELIRIRHEIYRLQTPETNAGGGTTQVTRDTNAGIDRGANGDGNAAGDGNGDSGNGDGDSSSSNTRSCSDRGTLNDEMNQLPRDRGRSSMREAVGIDYRENGRDEEGNLRLNARVITFQQVQSPQSQPQQPQQQQPPPQQQQQQHMQQQPHQQIQQQQQQQQYQLQQKDSIFDHLPSYKQQPQQQSYNSNTDSRDNHNNDSNRQSTSITGSSTTTRASSRTRSNENITQHLLEEVTTLAPGPIYINPHKNNSHHLLDNARPPPAETITTATATAANTTNINTTKTILAPMDEPHDPHDNHDKHGPHNKSDPNETILRLRQEILHLQQLLKASKCTVKIKHEEVIAARMEVGYDCQL